MDRIIVMVSDSADCLDGQNAVFIRTLDGIQEMMAIIGESLEAVRTIGAVRAEQNRLLEDTVRVNGQIAEAIRNENVQYVDIASMIEDNFRDIAGISRQSGNWNP